MSRPFSFRPWSARVAIALMLITLAALPAGAQSSDSIWVNPTGGNWQDPANWSDGIPTRQAEFLPLDPALDDPVFLTEAVAIEHLRAGPLPSLLLQGHSFQTGSLYLAASLRLSNHAAARSSFASFRLDAPRDAHPLFHVGRGVDFALLDDLNPQDPFNAGAQSWLDFTVTDGGTAAIQGDFLMPLREGSGPEALGRVNLSGTGSLLHITGNLIEMDGDIVTIPGTSDFAGPFPNFAITVADGAELRVDGSVYAFDASLDHSGASIDLVNGIVRVRTAFGQRQVRGHGVVIVEPRTDLSGLLIQNPIDRVELDGTLTVTNQEAHVFSLGPADLGILTTLEGSTLTSKSTLQLGDGDRLVAQGGTASEVAAPLHLANGIIEVADDGAGLTLPTGKAGLTGHGVVLGDVTNGAIANPDGDVRLHDELHVSARRGHIYSAGAARLGPRTTLAGGTLAVVGAAGTPGAAILPTDAELAGHGVFSAAFTGEPGSLVHASGGQLVVGHGSSGLSPGFTTAGNVLIDDGATLDVVSGAAARFAGRIDLAGGTLAADQQILLAEGAVLRGHGAVKSPVHASAGSILELTGNLSLGDAVDPTGFASDGQLHVGAHQAALLDADQALLGMLTTLGDSAGSPGTLTADHGAIVSFGRHVTGHATLASLDDPDHAVINQGTIAGNSADQPITLTGYVKGTGTFDHVTFTGTFSPGFSPASLTTGDVQLDSTATLLMELAGLDPGADYDQLIVDGHLALDGTLDVQLIDGFTPSLGDTFDLLDWLTLDGTFDTINLPTLTGGLTWDDSSLYTTGTVTVTPEPGSLLLLLSGTALLLPRRRRRWAHAD